MSPTNVWLVMKQIKVEEAGQEPISALRMAGRVSTNWGEMANSFIVTFRKAAVLDGKWGEMLVEAVECCQGSQPTKALKMTLESLRRSDSKVARTRLTSRCLRGSSARPVGGLKPRETIVMVGPDDA